MVPQALFGFGKKAESSDAAGVAAPLYICEWRRPVVACEPCCSLHVPARRLGSPVSRVQALTAAGFTPTAM